MANSETIRAAFSFAVTVLLVAAILDVAILATSAAQADFLMSIHR